MPEPDSPETLTASGPSPSFASRAPRPRTVGALVVSQWRGYGSAAFASGLSGPGRLHDLFVTLEAVTPGERINFQGVFVGIMGVTPRWFGDPPNHKMHIGSFQQSIDFILLLG